jgi:hypothetical protein
MTNILHPHKMQSRGNCKASKVQYTKENRHKAVDHPDKDEETQVQRGSVKDY